MRKVLTALLTLGCFAAATALSASTATAQVDAWNGGWHVGGDYYYPEYSSYGAAPIYDYGSAPATAYSYGSAPLYNYATAPAYGTTGYSSGPAPLYDYGAAPAYSSTGYTYGSAPLYNEVGPAYSPKGYNYAPAPLYDYGAAAAYGPAVIGAQIQPVRTIETVRTVYLPPRSVVRRETATGPMAMRHPAEVARVRPRQNETASNVAADAANSNGTGRTQPLYDTAAAPIAHAADARPPYRYVYQRNRILVVDPGTNAVVQTLRR